MGIDAIAPRKESHPSLAGKYLMVLLVVWTAIIAATFIWDRYTMRRSAVAEAHSAALASYNKDVAFREWATTHGGVYVPVDELTQPNPFLTHIKERDLITPSGRRLTLMNPAYMTRQINEFFSRKGNIFGHITSLKLRNPVNKPDAWEEGALKSFEQGEKERIEVADINGKPFLRLIRPLLIIEGCLKCHADQGYKVGDVRGGVSVSVGLEPYYAWARKVSAQHAIIYGLIWLFVSLGLLAGHRYMRRLERIRDEAKESLLAFSELKLDKALSLGRIGHWEHDPATNQTRWSDIMYEIFARDPKRGPPSLREEEGYFTPEQWDNLRSCRRRALEEGKTSSYDFETIIPGRGDIFLAGTITSFQSQEGGAKKLFGVVQDITNLKMNERKLQTANLELNAALEQLRQAQAILVRSEKLASIGILSAGVAHEILNPLNIISTTAQLTMMDEPQGPLHKKMGEILEQIQRAVKVVKNLGMFASKIKMEVEYVSLASCFDQVAGSMVADLIASNIIIERHFDPATPAVKADAIQLDQVFAILLANTRDAIGSRGKGTITATSRPVKRGAEFIFCDDGPGIPADIVEKVFDPFFTTKDPGRGTGLGLSIAHRIIEAHGGTLSVESGAGKGACFTIFLPKDGGSPAVS